MVGRSGEATELEMISTLMDLTVSPHHYLAFWMVNLVFGNLYLEIISTLMVLMVRPIVI